MIPQKEPFLPSSQTTLVLLFGASEWPYAPEYQSSPAFAYAARDLRTYFLSASSFALPSEHFLDLFDSPENASALLELTSLFLEKHIQQNDNGNAIYDVICYFIGHGQSIDRSSDFYLLHRRTRSGQLRASALPIQALADILQDKAFHQRHYVILDCCSASSAFTAFQAVKFQIDPKKLNVDFAILDKQNSFPRRGTSLLCSSSHKVPSLLLPNESSTLFSTALLEIFKQGSPHISGPLSLRNLYMLASTYLRGLSVPNTPQPVLLSPDQSNGDVADVPLFPNPLSIAQGGNTKERATKENAGQDIQQESKRTIMSRRNLLSAAIGTGIIAFGGLGVHYFISQRGPVVTYQGHTRIGNPAISRLAWSPDSQYIVSQAVPWEGKTETHVWKTSDGSLMYQVDMSKWGPYKDNGSTSYCLAWSPDGNYVAAGRYGRLASVWEAKSGRHIYTYVGHTNTVTYHILLGSEDIPVTVAMSGQVTVAWSPNSTYLASAVWGGENPKWGADPEYPFSGADSKVDVWKALDGQHIYQYREHRGYVTGVAWSPDGKYIASSDLRYPSSSDDESDIVSIWEAFTGKRLCLYDGRFLGGITWSPDGKCVASWNSLPDYAGMCDIWTPIDRQLLHRFPTRSQPTWSPDSKHLALASVDKVGRVSIWDVLTGKETSAFPGVQPVAWAPNGKYIAVATPYATIEIWRAP